MRAAVTMTFCDHGHTHTRIALLIGHRLARHVSPNGHALPSPHFFPAPCGLSPFPSYCSP
jgi:hypothetical protein